MKLIISIGIFIFTIFILFKLIFSEVSSTKKDTNEFIGKCNQYIILDVVVTILATFLYTQHYLILIYIPMIITIYDIRSKQLKDRVKQKEKKEEFLLRKQKEYDRLKNNIKKVARTKEEEENLIKSLKHHIEMCDNHLSLLNVIRTFDEVINSIEQLKYEEQANKYKYYNSNQRTYYRKTYSRSNKQNTNTNTNKTSYSYTIDGAFKLFGLNKEATVQDIKSKYRQLAKQHHPDMGGTNSNFLKLNSAYETLKEYYGI